MPRGELGESSEKLSSLCFEVSNLESASKRTVSAYLENYMSISKSKVRNLDSKIKEERKNNGIFGWLKGLFGFKKSNKDEITDRALATEQVKNFECNSAEESCVSSGQGESVRSKIKKAGYKSLVENNNVEDKFEKDKNNDMQQNQ